MWARHSRSSKVQIRSDTLSTGFKKLFLEATVAASVLSSDPTMTAQATQFRVFQETQRGPEIHR